MPIDNDYNRMLANEILNLNKAYVKQANAKSLTGSGMSGGDFLGTLAHLAPLAMLALGKPHKKGGNAYGAYQPDNIPANLDYGFTGTRIENPSVLGSGMSAGTRKYKKKGGADIQGWTKDASNNLQGYGVFSDVAHGVGDVGHTIGNVADFFGLAKPKQRRGKGNELGTIDATGFGESGGRKKGRGMVASGMSAGGMSAGVSLTRAVGSGMSAGGMSAGGMSAGKKKGKGESGGTKPKSAWQELVSKVAKQNGTGVKEAIAYIKSNDLY